MRKDDKQPLFDSISELNTLLFEVINDGVIIVNTQGTVIECNPAFHQRLGYEKDEVIGKSVQQLDPPEFAAKVPQRMREILQNGRAVFETAHYRKDGSVMPIEISARMVKVEGEALSLCIVRDISERKKMHAALDEKERMYSTLLKTSADGFWQADSQGKLIEVNEAYIKRSGYNREELLNMRIPDLEANESPEETKRHIEKIIRTGHDRFETWHRTRHGELWPVEIATTYLPGNGGMFFVFCTDISERKKAQEEIAAQQKELSKLSLALQQAGEGIIITDPNGIIEYANPAFSQNTGYAFHEAVGQPTSMLKSDAQDPVIYRELWQAISAGNNWEGTLIDRRKDGSFYPAMISIAPVFNDRHEIIHYVSIQKDITELKQMENQLVQAQKMESMGTLVGGIAHDFNNMLAAVQGNIFLALRNLHDPQALNARLNTISDLSEQASGVVNQLLTFAKKDIVEFETINLNKLIREGFTLAKSTIPESIHHHLNICEEQLNIDADATQLQQVMINLSNNAIDALEQVKKPEIIWSLQKFQATDAFRQQYPQAHSEQYAKITVRDNGSGIKKKHIEAIFDPFFTTKGPGKGTGLGLSMVYGSIQRHGGQLQVESSLERGTTFHIYLPLVQSEVNIDQVETSLAIRGNGQRVLLVDDEESLRLTTADVLHELGYKVFTASNGEDALSQYLEHQDHIDLILSDIVMPGIGGLELAREIRKMNEQVPIILATGYDQEHVSPASEEIENCQILTKPYSLIGLSQMMHEMLQS